MQAVQEMDQAYSVLPGMGTGSRPTTVLLIKQISAATKLHKRNFKMNSRRNVAETHKTATNGEANGLTGLKPHFSSWSLLYGLQG